MLLHKCNKGYTLVEIIIAIVIGLILIASVMATYVVQTRSNVSQQGVAEVTDQSKVAHDMIANNIKMAGFGAPDNMTQHSINNITTVIDPFDSTSAPDAITIVGGFRMIGTIWPNGTAPKTPCPAYVEYEDTTIDILLSSDLVPDTNEMKYLSFDGIQYVEATSVSTTYDTTDGDRPLISNTTFDPPLPLYFPLIDTTSNGNCDTGRPVYLVEAVTYCIRDTKLYRIWRNATAATCTANSGSDEEIIANNIEDLQFAYAIDSNGDGQLDTNGSNIVYYNAKGSPALTANPSTIRAVRINILARGSKPDLNFLSQGVQPANVENRDYDKSKDPDDFRRRWWQATVKIRN